MLPFFITGSGGDSSITSGDRRYHLSYEFLWLLHTSGMALLCEGVHGAAGGRESRPRGCYRPMLESPNASVTGPCLSHSAEENHQAVANSKRLEMCKHAMEHASAHENNCNFVVESCLRATENAITPSAVVEDSKSWKEI